MRDEARAQLEQVILPFWLRRGIDHEHGGFFTCFDNRGRSLLSTDKFTWSQGRFVWLLARAARLAELGLLDLKPDELAGYAERGAAFLAEHAVRDDGTCHYLLAADGTPIAGPDGATTSVYADCFVVMGMAELSRYTATETWLEVAEPILNRARTAVAEGTAATPPYPVPTGYTAFGPRMIIANALLEWTRARRDIGRLTDDDRANLNAALETMLRHREPDGTFREMIPHSADTSSLVARHRVPGHALEGMWVALEAAELLGQPWDERTDATLHSIDALCTAAWDDEHGGLLRFTDRDGAAEPSGSSIGGDTELDYEALVRRTWSSKLWWVHSEAAYTTALAATRYASAPAAGWFKRIWEYTLTTFPGGDDGEEWIQIRDRTGLPLDDVVALPVKDPFHIARNLMQIVELDATTDTIALPPQHPDLRWDGAVEVEHTPRWSRPWRLPLSRIELFPGENFRSRAATGAGVRICFVTDSTRIGGRVGRGGALDELSPIDLVIDGAVVGTARVDDDLCFRFDGLPAGDKNIELWLPQFGDFRLVHLLLDAGAAVRNSSPAPGPKLITYGSSITHCREASSPTRTWPALVARQLGLDLTCLGYGGEAHLDPMIARMIRDRPADVITTCLGINVYGNGTFNERSFLPAVLGFLSTIRDGHPDTPILVISPIYSPDREEQPGPGGMTLQQTRRDVEHAAHLLRGDGIPNVHLLSGLSVLGVEDAGMLHDGLHPAASGYELMAARITPAVRQVLTEKT